MKTFICLSVLVAAAFGASLEAVNPKIIPIISQESEVGIDGNFRSSFESANGIKVAEQGIQKNTGTKAAASEVVGSAEWTSPEGIQVYLKYIANEFGYQPEGNLLPTPPVDNNTPPPIPPAILRSLEWNAAHPEEDDSQQPKRA